MILFDYAGHPARHIDFRSQESLRAAATLAEIEKEFREIFGTLVHIEDDGGFQKFDAALKKNVNSLTV